MTIKHTHLILACLSVSIITILSMMKPALSADTKANSAVTVNSVIKEENLNTITLTQKAADNLGIETAKVTMKTMQQSRLYGGEIATPVGIRGAVTAPFAGLLKAPSQGRLTSGAKVTKGQPLFILMPFLTANAQGAAITSQVDAQTQTENAAINLEAAKVALNLAKRLFADGVGAKRTVLEAQAAYDTARETRNAAQERERILEESLVEGTAEPIIITAPESGTLRNVMSAHGQQVPAGAILFELGNATNAWVRVTLPMSDLAEMDLSQQAHVGALSAHASQAVQPAFPMQAPPLANAQNYTVETLYRLSDTTGTVIPGNRVGVTIPIGESNESKTIASGAVIYDALGGSWVYEEIEPLRYVRKRVTLHRVTGNDAIIASGTNVGTSLVVVGSQALFGAETGTMK